MIMSALPIILAIALIILSVVIKSKMPLWKGIAAEKRVYHKMLELPDEYNIFNDLLFQNNGRSVQIDHLIVSRYGVFVIETKGYKGWILGGENSEYWTQVIYKSKYQFYNPIRQNDGHVRFLYHLLKCSVTIPIIPIVVFDNSAELKMHLLQHTVINRRELLDTILSYSTPILNDETINWVIETIKAHCSLVDKTNMKLHKDNIKLLKQHTHQVIQERRCPKCGGQLVLRNGKYGKFYGCSNYPSCKFTLKA